MSAGLNGDQLTDVVELMTPALWAGDEDAQLALDGWLAQAEEVFDEQSLGPIALTLASATTVPADNTQVVCKPPPAGTLCTCSTADDWCMWPAPKTTHCVAAACVPTRSCGWFGASVCDGHCTGVGPTP